MRDISLKSIKNDYIFLQKEKYEGISTDGTIAKKESVHTEFKRFRCVFSFRGRDEPVNRSEIIKCDKHHVPSNTTARFHRTRSDHAARDDRSLLPPGVKQNNAVVVVVVPLPRPRRRRRRHRRRRRMRRCFRVRLRRFRVRRRRFRVRRRRRARATPEQVSRRAAKEDG